MSFKIEELVQHFPKLYHMAEADSWPSTRTHGLLSLTALLDSFEVNGARRLRIKSQRRPESVPIEQPVHGRAVIRDQKPISDSALRECLEGMTQEEWYRCLNLNRKAFFWVSKEGVDRLLGARAYRKHSHCAIAGLRSRLLALLACIRVRSARSPAAASPGSLLAPLGHRSPAGGRPAEFRGSRARFGTPSSGAWLADCRR
ncbi:MAG: DUF7002 family protein [Terriglobales bacterium]